MAQGTAHVSRRQHAPNRAESHESNLKPFQTTTSLRRRTTICLARSHHEGKPDEAVGDNPRTLKQACAPASRHAQDAFKDSMIHEACKSHHVSQFAAFFIDARAKRSIAKSHLYGMCCSTHTCNIDKPREMKKKGGKPDHTSVEVGMPSKPKLTEATRHSTRMILPQVHLRKPCYDFSFL